MSKDFVGKTALITGSTAGIGLATARMLHAAGASIILNGRSEQRIAAAVATFGDADRVSGIIADVGTTEGCDAIVTANPDVDILVNNAGVFAPRPLFEISDDEWISIFSVNVLSGIRLARAYIPRMMMRGWGRVIFVSSESALQIPPEMPHYGLTKTAQVAAARAFAQAAAGSGVTVNSVLPGPTESEGIERFVRELIPDHTLTITEAGKRFVETARPGSLIGRLATADEVAEVIRFLASPQSSVITGSSVRADGGVIQAIM